MPSLYEPDDWNTFIATEWKYRHDWSMYRGGKHTDHLTPMTVMAIEMMHVLDVLDALSEVSDEDQTQRVVQITLQNLQAWEMVQAVMSCPPSVLVDIKDAWLITVYVLHGQWIAHDHGRYVIMGEDHLLLPYHQIRKLVTRLRQSPVRHHLSERVLDWMTLDRC